jgi:guanine nucleotide-binding protein subunit beta-2-like 1 protein
MESNTHVKIEFAGFLFGHSGAVTSIVTGKGQGGDLEDTVLVSGSRDKTLIIWNLNQQSHENHYGEPFRCLTGHNHFVTDLDISNDDKHVISSSWDNTLRIWDLRYAKCSRKFIGHQREVESVCFSTDNSRIFSGGHEKSVNLWNVHGVCKNQSKERNHRQWVTKIRHSSSQKNEYYATVGRDGKLKLWSISQTCIASIQAHENYINALALSLNGQYICTGGKDNSVRVWDYNDLSKPYVEYKTESEINALAFNLQYQLVAAATDKNIKIWDIMNKKGEPLMSIEPEPVPVEQSTDEKGAKKPAPVRCTAIAWSTNLKKIYIGCSDGHIRVYNIVLSKN